MCEQRFVGIGLLYTDLVIKGLLDRAVKTRDAAKKHTH